MRFRRVASRGRPLTLARLLVAPWSLASNRAPCLTTSFPVRRSVPSLPIVPRQAHPSPSSRPRAPMKHRPSMRSASRYQTTRAEMPRATPRHPQRFVRRTTAASYRIANRTRRMTPAPAVSRVNALSRSPCVPPRRAATISRPAHGPRVASATSVTVEPSTPSCARPRDRATACAGASC
jgi:hypothetical protein